MPGFEHSRRANGSVSHQMEAASGAAEDIGAPVCARREVVTMKKLLMLAPAVPGPPWNGQRLATRRLLELYSSWFDVYLIAFADESESTVDLSELRKLCSHVCIVPVPSSFSRHRTRNLLTAAGSLVSPLPYKILKFRSARMRRAVADAISSGGFDMVHCEHLVMAQYAAEWRHTPKLLTEHNIEWEIFQRYAEKHPNLLVRLFARIEAAKLRRYEVAVCGKFDRVFVLSERDKEILESETGLTTIQSLTVPVGVAGSSERTRSADRLILSLGDLSNPAREDSTWWFAKEIFPQVQQRVPDVRWAIIGSDPSPRIRSLACSAIQVTGYVPDLDDYVRRARVCVVPLRIGGGIRIKILDMLSRGVPCVATPVAVQGLGLQHDEHILVAREPEGFAAATAEVLTNDATYSRLADVGREFVLANNSPDVARQELGRTVTQLVEHSADLAVQQVETESATAIRNGAVEVSHE